MSDRFLAPYFSRTSTNKHTIASMNSIAPVASRMTSSKPSKTISKASKISRLSALFFPTPSSTPKSVMPLINSFSALPVEIILQILNYLSLPSLLSFRHTCHSFMALTSAHETYLINSYIRTSVPVYLLRLYPVSSWDVGGVGGHSTFQYLLTLHSKQSTSSSLSSALAKHILKEMLPPIERMGMDKEIKRQMIGRLKRRMAPLVLTLGHFFDSYHQSAPSSTATTASAIETDPVSVEQDSTERQKLIMETYPDSLFPHVHQMFSLLLRLFYKRMTSRTPLLRRWNLSVDSFAQLLVSGGLKEVNRIYRIQGYWRRRWEMRRWLKGLEKENRARMNSGKGERIKGASLMERGRRESGESKVRMGQEDLLALWTPAAEERLLQRGMVEDLEEVGCCGRFVGMLLEEDSEDDGDGDDEDGDDDWEEDEEYEDEDEESAYAYGALTGEFEHWEQVLEVAEHGF